ncbi:MAG: folate-binding protein YgfZ [Rhizobium sp.]
MPAAYLPDRAFIRITGPEAEHFLQNLITTDVLSLPASEAWPGALLTPQGKILFDFLVSRVPDGFVLETSVSQLEGLAKRLTMYKLRAAVDIAADTLAGVTVHWGEEQAASGVLDKRFEIAGVILTREPGKGCDNSQADYHALRLLNGIAESGNDFALQDAFPHDILMDLNRGVGFKKGCYVGQEVVSRMHHRGTARRRAVIVSAETALPPPGTEILASGKPVGTLGSVAANRGLAVIRIDRAGEAMATGTPVLAGDLPVTLTLPSWTGLTFPTASEEA